MRANNNLNFSLDIMTSVLKTIDIINNALRFREYYNMHYGTFYQYNSPNMIIFSCSLTILIF